MITVEARNGFKGLDLIDRVPDELWTEVPDIVQETGIKTVSMEKKCKKAKWLSEEDLQIAVLYYCVANNNCLWFDIIHIYYFIVSIGKESRQD